jgi:hypothetical protein
MLKPALKNGNEGRQYVTDTTRRYISYNNNGSIASLATDSFVNHASPRSSSKMGIRQQMNMTGRKKTTGSSSLTLSKTTTHTPSLSPTRRKVGTTVLKKTSPRKDSILIARSRQQNNNESMMYMSGVNLSFDLSDYSGDDDTNDSSYNNINDNVKNKSETSRHNPNNHDRQTNDCNRQNSSAFYFT